MAFEPPLENARIVTTALLAQRLALVDNITKEIITITGADYFAAIGVPDHPTAMVTWSQGLVTINGVQECFLAQFSGTVDSLLYRVGSVASSSFIVNVQIVHLGTPTSVTGLGALTVNSNAYTRTNSSGAKNFVADDIIQVTITSATNSPSGGTLFIITTRS